MSKLKFSDLSLCPPIQKTLQEIGYSTPTPIQEQTIPLVLEGHDVLGIAQTGTGKTASFCLPIINDLYQTDSSYQRRSAKVLILTPTRELAIQIHQNLESYGQKLDQKYAVIFGGVSQNPQVKAIKFGVDVLVATPGRLLDLIQQKHILLDQTETFVLDEADRMLDMGFAKDIEKVLRLLPKKRHNLFFSATMPKAIQKLANAILNHPKKVEVTPESTTVEKIEQSVMYVEKKNKVDLLIHLLQENKKDKVLVFIAMKHMANRVAKKLETNGIKTAVIHGNKSQSARQRAIQDFTEDRVGVMLATDIASRGIDIDGITHVINFELSNIAESYVHRIGRTARAGALGSAISLVTGDEKSYLANVERATKQKIYVNTEQPFHSQVAMDAPIMSVGKAKAKLEAEQKRASREAFRSRPKKTGKKKTASTNQKRPGKPSKKKSSFKKKFSR